MVNTFVRIACLVVESVCSMWPQFRPISYRFPVQYIVIEIGHRCDASYCDDVFCVPRERMVIQFFLN